MVRAALLLAVGLAAGLAVDYAGGGLVAASAVAALPAGYLARPARSAALGALAGVAWLALAYALAAAAMPGSTGMIALTAEIAGLPQAALYAVAFLLAALTGASTAALAGGLLGSLRPPSQGPR